MTNEAEVVAHARRLWMRSKQIEERRCAIAATPDNRDKINEENCTHDKSSPPTKVKVRNERFASTWGWRPWDRNEIL